MPSPFRVVPCWVKARNLPRHALRTPLAGSCEKSRTLTSQTLRFDAGMTGRRSCSQPGGSVRAGVQDHAPRPVHARRAGVGVGGGARCPTRWSPLK